MRKSARRTVKQLCAAAVIATAALSSGCDDSNATVFVRGTVIPEGDGCTVDPNGDVLLRGLYNVEAGGSYTLFPIFSNQLRTRAGSVASDPNGVHIDSVEVELRDEGGLPLAFDGLPNPFQVATSTFIPSAAGTSASSAGAAVEVIPAVYSGQLPTAGTIIAALKAFGETNGRVNVESDEWTYPIELCGGSCLFVCDPMATTNMPCCTPGANCISTTAGPCL